MNKSLIATLMLIVTAGSAFGGPGDETTCRFILPGSFAKALERAKTTDRCLLIKGVAFGMDALGATDCTKGHW